MTYLNRDNVVPNVGFVIYHHVNFGHAQAIDRSIVYSPLWTRAHITV